MRDYIYYALPTYKSFEHARAGVLAALASTRMPDKIIIVDNSGDGSGTRALHDLTTSHADVYIWPQTYNLGVARAWNLIHRQLDTDYIIIANDDVAVHPETIEALYYGAKEHNDSPIIYGNGAIANVYSLFVLRQWAFQKYGGFDEQFYPAYFEDNDMVYRLHTLEKHAPINIERATYNHVGSSTLQKYTAEEMSMHHTTFQANQAYYIRKWGGLPTQEVFTRPFNI